MTKSFGELNRFFELSYRGTHAFIDAIESQQLLNCDLSSNVVVQHGSTNAVNCLSLEKNESRYLLSGGVGGAICLYDLEQPSWESGPITPLLQQLQIGTVSSLQWYPEDTGAFIAASMTGELSIYDTNEFIKVASFKFPGSVVQCARMRNCSGSSNVVALIAVGLQDGTVRLIDPRSQDSSHVLKGHSLAVNCVEWSTAPGDVYSLVSGGMDGAVRVWDVRRAGGIAEAALRSFDWRGDFRANARIDTSKLYTSLYPSRSSAADSAVSIIGESLRIYQSGGRARASLPVQQAAKAHDAGVTTMIISSCGNHVLTGGNDRQLRLWRMSTGELLPVKYADKLIPSSQLPFGICIAESSCAANDLLIAPTGSGATVRCECNVSAVALKRVTSAVGGDHPSVTAGEGDIALIPVHSSDGQPVRILKGHLERVTSIVYRRSRHQIVSAGKDGMVFVWDAMKHNSNGNSNNTNSRVHHDQSISRTETYSAVQSSSSRKHHELYYGAASRRYDFSQIQERVLDGLPGNAGNAGNIEVSVAVNASKKRLRVELPMRECDEYVVVSESRAAVAVSEGNSNTGSDSDSNSGDDWSDDEPFPTQHSQHADNRKQSQVSASVVNISETDIGRNHSRSFLPPILQQYMKEASRSNTNYNISSSSSSSSNAPPPPPPLPPTAARIVQHLDWENVDQIFSHPLGSEPSGSEAAAAAAAAATTGVAGGVRHDRGHNNEHLLIAQQSLTSTTTPERAIAPTIAASPAPLAAPMKSADQRYAEWVKQQRLKSKANKKK